MKHYPLALTIAGSDSGGGAGIQADLKTFSALGCYGMSVITALTAQNTQEVRAIHPVPPSFIRHQIEAVLEDIGVQAVKIGMLFSSQVIEQVAWTLKAYKVGNIVLDPVMVAKSGDLLIETEAVEAMKELLFPLATLITPNLPEAAFLLGLDEENLPTMEEVAIALAQTGPQAVLVKGGHLAGTLSSDVLFIKSDQRCHTLSEKRVSTNNSHGTGCTLSAAVAAHLAKGLPLEEAVQKAKKYLTGALEAGADYQLGKGHGPVHHFHQWWV